MPVLEEILTDENLSALMEGRDVGSGWPRSDGDEYLDEFVGGIFRLPYWLMHCANGWSSLIRAFFTLVLPMQREGQVRPIRVLKMARSQRTNVRWPVMQITAHNFDDYRWGIAEFVSEHSGRTCPECGLLLTDGPGRRYSDTGLGGSGRVRAPAPEQPPTVEAPDNDARDISGCPATARGLAVTIELDAPSGWNSPRRCDGVRSHTNGLDHSLDWGNT